MTERKVRMIVAAFLLGAVRSDQYDALFSSSKGRNKCIRQLCAHRFLERAHRTSSRFAAPVYHLGRAGLPVAIADLAAIGFELSPEQLRSVLRRPPYSRFDHAVGVGAVYWAFCDPSKESAARFIPEPAVRFDFDIRVAGTDRWRRRRFAPDAALVVPAGPDGPSLVFVEVDMATVPLARFAEKYRAFRHVVEGRLAAERFECPSPVFAIVTSSNARLDRLAKLARQETGDATVVLTTLDNIGVGGDQAVWLDVRAGSHDVLASIMERAGGTRCTV